MIKKNLSHAYTPDEQRNDISDEVAENNISLLLLKQNIGFMKETIEKINDNIVELRVEMKSNFVSKEEHDHINIRVTGIENNWSWIIRVVLGSIIVSVLAVIGLKK